MAMIKRFHGSSNPAVFDKAANSYSPHIGKQLQCFAFTVLRARGKPTVKVFGFSKEFQSSTLLESWIFEGEGKIEQYGIGNVLCKHILRILSHSSFLNRMLCTRKPIRTQPTIVPASRKDNSFQISWINDDDFLMS